MDNLRAKEPGPRYCHFPKRDDYGPGYFAGLLSEHLIYDEKSARHPWKWDKIPGHERNEVLDCRNYANAAFKALPKDLDAIDRRLKAARAQKSSGAALKEAEQRVDELEALASGGNRRKAVGVIPRGW